jgi:hypothetical protein
LDGGYILKTARLLFNAAKHESNIASLAKVNFKARLIKPQTWFGVNMMATIFLNFSA